MTECRAEACPDRQNTIDLWVIAWAVLRQLALPLCQLSVDEEQRACGMALDSTARDYRYARSLLRCLLAVRLGCAPTAVDFEYGQAGKPVLADGPAFNVSHSRSTLVIAIADNEFGGRLGVDVEEHVTDKIAASLPARCFSANERQCLQQYPVGASRCVAFTRGWTRKEAVVKAEGGGITLALDKFDVSLADHGTCAGRSVLNGSDLPWLLPQCCVLIDPGPHGQNEMAIAVMFDQAADSCRLVRRDIGLDELAALAPLADCRHRHIRRRPGHSDEQPL